MRWLVGMGGLVQIEFAGPQEFARRLEVETKLYGDIIRAAKITMPK